VLSLERVERVVVALPFVKVCVLRTPVVRVLVAPGR
jgi:hypothetical protein